MASKATEKPTGLCAACQKEGASSRCRSCLDVGIDFFFCNRECQVKHWKKHKAVCGKASARDDSTAKDVSSEKKRAKSLRKVLKGGNKILRACYNCTKTEKEDNVKLSNCSACNSAVYCSQECQKAHWPKHKERCKHNSAMRQEIDCTLTPTEKNIYNLFNQWKSNPSIVPGALHAKCHQLMDIQECPPTKIMIVSLEFDYNLKTFVHAEEPSVIPLSLCPKECQEMLERSLNHVGELKNFNVGFRQYAIVTCKELGSKHAKFMDMHFEEGILHELTKETLSHMEKICKRIPLKSDLFHGWDGIRKSNLEKQFVHLKKCPVYTSFLCNAMQLFNNKGRLSLCGIVIYIKLGKELGKISDFVKYEKMPKSEIKKLKENMSVNTDLPQQPVMVLVAYKDIETDSIFRYDAKTCFLDTSGNRSVETYKRNANYCFKQLQDSVKKIPLELIEKVSL